MIFHITVWRALSFGASVDGLTLGEATLDSRVEDGRSLTKPLWGRAVGQHLGLEIKDAGSVLSWRLLGLKSYDPDPRELVVPAC